MFLFSFIQLDAQTDNVQPKFKTVIVNIPPLKTLNVQRTKPHIIVASQSNFDKLIIDSLAKVIEKDKVIYEKLIDLNKEKESTAGNVVIMLSQARRMAVPAMYPSSWIPRKSVSMRT